MDQIPAWDIFFVGSDREIFNELLWAVQRPGSMWPSNLDDADHAKIDLRKVDFRTALTDGEQEHLSNYISACVANQMQVFSLNQNPEHVDTRSNWENLQTLIKNAGVMWTLVALVQQVLLQLCVMMNHQKQNSIHLNLTKTKTLSSYERNVSE